MGADCAVIISRSFTSVRSSPSSRVQGLARCAIRPTEGTLRALLPKTAVPDQPGKRVPSTWSPGDLERLSADEQRPLTLLGSRSVENFAFPRGWGYIKDRQHVAGFLSHRFSGVPEAEYPRGWSTKPGIRWTVRTLDLVGLLLHEQPVVYVSEHLPAMDELSEAPTRPLDKFESLTPDRPNCRRRSVHQPRRTGIPANAWRHLQHQSVRRLPRRAAWRLAGGVFVYAGARRT